jgi:archaellin
MNCITGGRAYEGTLRPGGGSGDLHTRSWYRGSIGHEVSATNRDLAYSKVHLGKDDLDDLLEPGKLYELPVNLTGVGEIIGSYHTFTVEATPQVGSTLQIERKTPARLDTVMILN